MKQVYAMVRHQLSVVHIATSGAHTEAGNGPARFTEYGQNVGGARTVALLEAVINDFVKTDNDSIAAEGDV